MTKNSIKKYECTKNKFPFDIIITIIIMDEWIAKIKNVYNNYNENFDIFVYIFQNIPVFFYGGLDNISYYQFYLTFYDNSSGLSYLWFATR